MSRKNGKKVRRQSATPLWLRLARLGMLAVIGVGLTLTVVHRLDSDNGGQWWWQNPTGAWGYFRTYIGDSSAQAGDLLREGGQKGRLFWQKRQDELEVWFEQVRHDLPSEEQLVQLAADYSDDDPAQPTFAPADDAGESAAAPRITMKRSAPAKAPAPVPPSPAPEPRDPLRLPRTKPRPEAKEEERTRPDWLDEPETGGVEVGAKEEASKVAEVPAIEGIDMHAEAAPAQTPEGPEAEPDSAATAVSEPSQRRKVAEPSEPAVKPEPVLEPMPAEEPEDLDGDGMAAVEAHMAEGVAHWRRATAALQRQDGATEQREIKTALRKFDAALEILLELRKERPDDPSIEKLLLDCNRFRYDCIKRTKLSLR